MKRSDKATGYVLIRAYTNSEWDSCDFAIIHITPEWLQRFVRYYGEAERLYKNDSSFAHIEYWSAPKGFYIDNDDSPDTANEILGTETDWSFVELEQNELDNLPVPENALNAFLLRITHYGQASFRAYGKHTGEEFYTAHFNIAALDDMTKQIS